MSHRFIKDRSCTDGSFIRSGGGRRPVEAYGHIVLTVSTPSGEADMTLLNVLYVPGLGTNLVGGKLLKDKGLLFDNGVPHLYRELTDGKRETAVHVIEKGPYCLLEDHTDSTTTTPVALATSKAGIKSASAVEWHYLLAHVNSDAIQRLPGAAEGVEITDKNAVPKTNKCEACALSKAHRIVSRSSAKAETSDKPFYRISFDLMQLNPALNKDQWVSHVACTETDFQMVYTHRKKSEVTEILRKVLQMIRKRWFFEVAFIRSDNEKSLGNEFKDLCFELGLTWEPTAADTPAQNGHSERKGSLLSTKARVMREDAGLPNYLWPWMYQTVGFLMNRTPMRKHNWKTPFEMVTGHLPDLSHLKRYGCKAYPLDKYIARKDKLTQRAHIGFLVGYDGTNIFNIWIPSQRKVIRTRDVTFNKTDFL